MVHKVAIMKGIKDRLRELSCSELSLFFSALIRSRLHHMLFLFIWFLKETLLVSDFLRPPAVTI